MYMYEATGNNCNSLEWPERVASKVALIVGALTQEK